jgi:glycogen debranching enzyme
MTGSRTEAKGLPARDADLRDHLAFGDAIITCRKLASPYRMPPLSTVRALLRLGRVDRLDELGAAGPLHAATTADTPADADPELRKFEAVFARDALLVIEFIGNIFPRLRRTTVYALAQVQGVEYDAAREEEPGKIVHEWRDSTDPVAQEITAQRGWGWPYYGAVDTTPLFIRTTVALLEADPAAGAAQVKQRDGRRCMLVDSLISAIGWLCRRMDDDPDGLLTYRRINPRGIENQIWRDSWDSLSHADGGLVNHDRPVAALDVQALAYDALVAAARHLRTRSAEETRAAGALDERAQRVRNAVLERFWIEDGGIGFFAGALDFSPTGARRPLRTRISDMGHLLKSGVLHGKNIHEYRDAVVRQLFSPGLLCAAGIRSLDAGEVRYWPGGYHTGNSWLWQSMHIADGLEQYGFAQLAEELRNRCHRVHLRTGLLPEFARGNDEIGVLNDRIVDVWQAADQRENRLEQPPQEVQAWTVASLYAAKRRTKEKVRPLPPPTRLEQDILEELPDRPDNFRTPA